MRSRFCCRTIFSSAFATLLCVSSPASAQLKLQMALWTMDRSGADAKKFFQAPGMMWNGSPAWSEDGARIAFDGYEGINLAGESQLFVVEADGTGLRGLGIGSTPTWEPGDRRILFAVFPGAPSGGQRPGIWIVNADGTGRERLFDGKWPAYAPDGDRIGYVKRDDDGLERMYVFDEIEATHRSLYVRGYQRVYGPIWSPDGRRFCFHAWEDGAYNLCLFDLDAEQPMARVLRRTNNMCRPAWSPDGHQILFRDRAAKQPGKEEYLVIDPDSGKPATRLERNGAAQRNSDPSYSPDGSRIIFPSSR